MPADSIGVVILKLIIEVVKKVSPEGLANIRLLLTGKTLLILGPARSGKSTLVDYLEHGELEGEHPTQRTVNTEATASFAVHTGQGTSLEVKVRRAVDVPGHHLPAEQVKILSERQPDALLVLSDLSKPLEAAGGQEGERAWFADLCDHLSDEFLRNPEASEKLKCILVVLNKKDKSTQADLDARIAAYRAILDHNLKRGWGTRVNDIQLLPCVLVRNAENAAPVDAVIRALARCLQ